MLSDSKTGYPSIDKPWLRYYSQKDINTPLPEETLYSIFKRCNVQNLQKTAINYYGQKISYQNLFKNIDVAASALENIGVCEGSIVSVCMLNSPETIYLILALNKIGAAANMLYGMDTSHEIKQHILDAESKFIFTLDIFQEKIEEAICGTSVEKVIVSSLTQEMSLLNRTGAKLLGKIKRISLSKDPRFISWKQFISYNNGQSKTVDDPTIPAFITYTGGTTGGSKGVVLNSAAILAVSEQYIIGDGKLNSSSTWMLVLPLFIAFGVICLSVPLMIGMTIIVRLPMSETIGEICKKFRPNYFIYSPAFWETFANKEEKMDLSFLVSPISGGDVLTNKAEKKINEYFKKCGCKTTIMNGYGMSEVCAAVSVNYGHIYEFGSVGVPFIKNIISAFDVDSGKELPYGQEGEICIHTPSMMLGYLNNQTETDNIIKKHDDGLLWVHSGDLGYISENGFVHISGRLKRYCLTFYNGVAKKVFSLDVEKKMIQCPFVENCVAVPINHKDYNQVHAAYVILAKGVEANTETEAALYKYANENMDFVYRPFKFIFVNQYPRTKVGKIDYRALELSSQ